MKRLSSASLVALVAGMLSLSPAQAAVGPTDDPVLYWNSIVVSTVPGGPPVQSRSAAIVNIAIFDAVNAALGKPNNGYSTGVAVTGGDTRAAASQAAHDVLVKLNPGGTATYDAALAASLSQVSNVAARTAGVATGAAYATAILATRGTDGAAGAGAVPYTAAPDPGVWRPTPPGNLPAALPGWGAVTPFVLDSGSQFRPGPPPALGSPEYAAAYNEVMALGSLTNSTRTADQTASAKFWANANGLTWLQIGVETAADNGLSTLANATLFALLTTSVGDAFIAGFDTKYTYDFWRPVTAIQNGNLDGNPLTIGDPNWTSLITAPNHPGYLSTHSIASGAGATILGTLLGQEGFCTTLGTGANALTQCFSSFAQAEQNAADSRLWGGIHFAFDNAAGLTAGESIARFSLADGIFQAVPEPSTWAMMLIGFGFIGMRIRRDRRSKVRQAAGA